jgi:glutamyl-tRNA synthetase
MIRTRFAVSPTGFLHIGGARSALYDWLFARSQGGKLILRIEDTDKDREVEGGVDHILESLKWLGIDWDEGPDIGGEHGPYTQSERLDIYKEYAQKLLDTGHAYADPYTTEEVNAFRTQAQHDKRAFLYRDHRPANPPAWDGSQPLRLKVADIKSYTWHDSVRGELSAGEEALDDIVLIKSDGFPTYNFAHIIDDHLMGITHVLRGEEFIASVPKYLSIYDAFGWEAPVMATLPPIMAPSGNKKLSKRDGAPDVLAYRDQGYMPETIINFLALMGWNDGSEQEVYSVDELIKTFDIARVQRSGARYDDQRLQWISGHHIRNLDIDDLFTRTVEPKNWWPASAENADIEHKKHVLALVQEKLKTFSELAENVEFFFSEPNIMLADILVSDKQLAKLGEQTAHSHLEAACASLTECDFSEADLETKLRALVEQLDTKTGVLFKLIRHAITGRGIAPGLFETLATLGKETSLSRIQKLL